MRAPLRYLKPGTRFRVRETGVEAVLQSVNECRAVVKVHRGERDVFFTQPDGTERAFRAQRVKVESWSTAVVVDVLELPQEVTA